MNFMIDVTNEGAKILSREKSINCTYSVISDTLNIDQMLGKRVQRLTLIPSKVDQMVSLCLHVVK